MCRYRRRQAVAPFLFYGLSYTAKHISDRCFMHSPIILSVLSPPLLAPCPSPFWGCLAVQGARARTRWAPQADRIQTNEMVAPSRAQGWPKLSGRRFSHLSTAPTGGSLQLAKTGAGISRNFGTSCGSAAPGAATALGVPWRAATVLIAVGAGWAWVGGLFSRRWKPWAGSPFGYSGHVILPTMLCIR